MITGIMKPVEILIAGDLAPTPSNHHLFSSGEIGKLIAGDLLEIISRADVRLFNLEVPLTDHYSPISKDGPVLEAPVSSINGIRMLEPTLVNLANNHIMDHDVPGLESTMKALSENEIRFAGAGRNLEEASQPVIIHKAGLRIGFYACAEHEFSIAGHDRAGANPIDPLVSFDQISSLKSKCDFVVVLHHGGKEHYRYPSPGLQKVCRKMLESGADLVVCQHSHCVGSFEQYNGGTIVYGQGNFLFDRHDNEFWGTALLVKAILSDKPRIEFIPVKKNGLGVKLPDQSEGNDILEGFLNRSQQIMTPGFVEEQFGKYCLEYGQYYLATLAGFGKSLRRADKYLGRPLTRLVYSRKKMDIIRNHFECETHRELIIEYLRQLTKKK